MTRITGISLRRVLDSRGNPPSRPTCSPSPAASAAGQRPAGPRPASTKRSNSRPTNPSRRPASTRFHASKASMRATSAPSTTHCAPPTGRMTSPRSAPTARSRSRWRPRRPPPTCSGAPLYQHLGGAFRGENFPIPLGNVVGGGEHAKEATHIQEFLAAPVGAPSVSEAVFANAAVHAAVADVLDERGVPAAKGDEGAWAPRSRTRTRSRSSTRRSTASRRTWASRSASASIWPPPSCTTTTRRRTSTAETKSTDEQIDYVADLVDEYDLAYVEDPLDENDYEAFAELTDRVGDRTMICGDDLFVTKRRAAPGRDRHGRGQQHPDQAEPDRDAVGHVRRYRTRRSQRVRRSFPTARARRRTRPSHTSPWRPMPGSSRPARSAGERTAKLNELVRIADDAV